MDVTALSCLKSDTPFITEIKQHKQPYNMRYDTNAHLCKRSPAKLSVTLLYIQQTLCYYDKLFKKAPTCAVTGIDNNVRWYQIKV